MESISVEALRAASGAVTTWSVARAGSAAGPKRRTARKSILRLAEEMLRPPAPAPAGTAPADGEAGPGADAGAALRASAAGGRRVRGIGHIGRQRVNGGVKSGRPGCPLLGLLPK